MNRRVLCTAIAFLLLGCSGDQGPVSYAIQLAPTTLSLALGGTSGTATVSATVTRANIVDNSVPVALTTSDADVATVTSTS